MLHLSTFRWKWFETALTLIFGHWKKIVDSRTLNDVYLSQVVSRYPMRNSWCLLCQPRHLAYNQICVCSFHEEVVLWSRFAVFVNANGWWCMCGVSRPTSTEFFWPHRLNQDHLMYSSCVHNFVPDRKTTRACSSQLSIGHPSQHKSEQQSCKQLRKGLTADWYATVNIKSWQICAGPVIGWACSMLLFTY